MNDTIVISFANQKGGVGKSTLNAMLANYIHNETTLSVMVSDSDNQQTLSEMRDEDIKELKGLRDDPENKEKVLDEEDLYYLLPVHAKDFVSTLENGIHGEFDVCILDVPGTLDAPGVVESLVAVDYLFIPMGTGRKETDGSLKFFDWYMENVKPVREDAGFEVNVFGVLNGVKKNMLEYKEFLKIKNDMPLKFLDIDLPDNDTTFERWSNTYETLSYSTGGTIVEDFCKEVMTKCSLEL